jgi:hypothetical protein
MPLTINWIPKHEDKVITMGKEKADYYPPGATEPIVRPAHIAPPAVPIADVESKGLKEAATTPPVSETVKKEPKVATKRPAAKK